MNNSASEKLEKLIRSSIQTLQIALLIASAVVVAISAGCSSSTNLSDNARQSSSTKNVNSGRIVTVSYALQYLTQRVAGDDFTVEFPAAEADDPKAWKPSVSDIASIQKADLIVINGPGAEYAQWLTRVTLPESKICNSCQDFKLRDYIIVKDHQIIHSHGPEGEHSHPYFVPYPWLDPKMAIKQADKIRQSLTEIYPNESDSFQSNFAALKKDLDEIAAEIPATGSNENEQITVTTANPHLKYLTRAMGFNDVHLQWFDSPDDSEVESAAKDLSEKIRKSKAMMFVAGYDFPKTLADILSNLKCKLINVDQIDKQPTSGNFMDATRQNISKLKN